MGRMVILAYKAHEGKETELRQLIRDHRHVLVEKGLVTDLTPIHMKTESGAIVEVFEWRADEAVETARLDSSVSHLWDAFSSVCDFQRLRDLSEAADHFANFDRIHILSNSSTTTSTTASSSSNKEEQQPIPHHTAAGQQQQQHGE